MSVISGFISGQSLAGYANIYLASDLVEHGTDGDIAWPPALMPMSAAACASLVRTLPIAANGRVIASRASLSYSDDFYHRIHVNPAELDLGNVVSTQVTSVS